LPPPTHRYVLVGLGSHTMGGDWQVVTALLLLLPLLEPVAAALLAPLAGNPTAELVVVTVLTPLIMDMFAFWVRHTEGPGPVAPNHNREREGGPCACIERCARFGGTEMAGGGGGGRCR
jgi:hypothetical protein